MRIVYDTTYTTHTAPLLLDARGRQRHRPGALPHTSQGRKQPRRRPPRPPAPLSACLSARTPPLTHVRRHERRGRRRPVDSRRRLRHQHAVPTRATSPRPTRQPPRSPPRAAPPAAVLPAHAGPPSPPPMLVDVPHHTRHASMPADFPTPPESPLALSHSFGSLMMDTDGGLQSKGGMEGSLGRLVRQGSGGGGVMADSASGGWGWDPLAIGGGPDDLPQLDSGPAGLPSWVAPMVRGCTQLERVAVTWSTHHGQ